MGILIHSLVKSMKKKIENVEKSLIWKKLL